MLKATQHHSQMVIQKLEDTFGQVLVMRYGLTRKIYTSILEALLLLHISGIYKVQQVIQWYLFLRMTGLE